MSSLFRISVVPAAMAQGCPPRVADPALPSICLETVWIPSSRIRDFPLSSSNPPPPPNQTKNKTSLYLEEEGVIFTWLGEVGCCQRLRKNSASSLQSFCCFLLEFVFFLGGGEGARIPCPPSSKDLGASQPCQYSKDQECPVAGQ